MATLSSEEPKKMKLLTRDCQHCGVTCAISYKEHLLKCNETQKVEKEFAEPNNIETETLSLECYECELTFDSFEKIEQHNNYHSGLHPYLCKKCGWSFRTSSGRQKHMKRRHSLVEMVKCGICERQFKCQEFLRDHIKRMHPDRTAGKIKTASPINDIAATVTATNGYKMDQNTRSVKNIKIPKD